jgi:hypothetical protein
MLKISVCKDLEEARRLWQRHWPQKCLFDFWPVRACFQSQFNHSPYFLVARMDGKFYGMLPLSWIDEAQCFGHFPGELWHGETWLEQNKIIAGDPEVFTFMLNHVPAAAKIRYLVQNPELLSASSVDIDETGYLFFPKQYDYSFQAYLQSFSGKSRKKLRCELNRLEARGVCFRHDCFSDVEDMFRLNLESFGAQSYFSDLRFLRSFENLTDWLYANNLLRVTTVLIGGRIAAVDIGAIWGRKYTVLAGGTHAEFPGVAKLINFHHIEWACQQRLAEVDFLCGEFNWKHRFHLTARPLYKIWSMPARREWEMMIPSQGVSCAA